MPSTRPWPKFVPLLLLPFASMAGPASAQTVPGFDGGHDSARAQHRAYAIEEFQKVYSGWLEAVQAGDADRAAEFYTDDAFLYLGDSANGRGDVQSALTDWLQEIDHVQTGMTDFDASGSMSYVSLNLMVDGFGGGDNGPGTMILVLKRVRGGWRIRSHTVVMHPGTPVS